MKILFKNNKNMSSIICFGIFLCFFDAVLRIEQKNGITLDRIFLIIPILGMLIYEGRVYYKFLIIFLCFFAYNAILSLKFGSFEYFSEMSLHYFIIFNLFLFVNYLVESEDGRAKLLKTLLLGCGIFIATTLSQIAFGYHLPNVDIYENNEYSGFFRIANDQSLALAGFVPILFLMLHEKKLSTIIAGGVIFGIVYICLNNHTKTALGAVILFLILYGMMQMRINILVTLILLATSVFLARDQTISISYQEYTINELIIEPISYLTSFTTYETLGSIETRVNASIIGLREIFDTYATGIGYGNSVVLLNKPENQLEFAKSLHNDTLAFLLEQGLLAVAIYAYMIHRVFIATRSSHSNLIYIKRCSFYTLPVAILSSSGISSNYFFLTCLFFLINSTERAISSSIVKNKKLSRMRMVFACKIRALNQSGD